MSRHKGSKNRNRQENELPITEVEPESVESKSEVTEQQDKTVSMFEAADQLNTTEATIKTWVDHGHLKRSGNGISVRSIRECRFNNQRRFS